MKELWQRATFPALGIAFLQFLTMTVASCSSVRNTTPDWHAAFTRAFFVLGLNLSLTLAGGVFQALPLRRKGVPLSGCALGGAIVGLLANLFSQTLGGFLLAALTFQSSQSSERWMGWTLLSVSFFVNLLVFGIAGIVLGGAGGGLVGIFAARPSPGEPENGLSRPAAGGPPGSRP